ncbi:FtsQ-type POTRA domain-containing protein [Pseudolysinimonas yzui]|uniref:Cell division protein FtsQ n=1 Tax=Pseudolysinimonas yzui TaxID=2708254 RepID=A0A8J3LZG5_9MICO|nr:FtsQ-type POTRA domain-containing protein [Pseudolysinimonas yzui]GHF10107.1 cell division protein FtsQ [Pseudolysinimonas yzui]
MKRAATPAAQPKVRAEQSARKADRVRQRYERAEVKRFTRHARRRRIGGLVVLGVLASTAGLIAAAVFSPILALREIRVDGTVRLDPAVVQEAVSGQLGTPLALLDEARIRDELGQFTSIRSYVTELVPPDTLVIHIVERTPLGVIATPAGFDVVDAAGVVLESSPARPANLPLMQIDGSEPDGTGFDAMAEVLIALPPDVLAQVDSIGARTQDDVTLSLTGSDQRVVWGSADDSERKADILAALLARFATAGPGEYDVSAPGSAVFRLD